MKAQLDPVRDAVHAGRPQQEPQDRERDAELPQGSGADRRAQCPLDRSRRIVGDGCGGAISPGSSGPWRPAVGLQAHVARLAAKQQHQRHGRGRQPRQGHPGRSPAVAADERLRQRHEQRAADSQAELHDPRGAAAQPDEPLGHRNGGDQRAAGRCCPGGDAQGQQHAEQHGGRLRAGQQQQPSGGDDDRQQHRAARSVTVEPAADQDAAQAARPQAHGLRPADGLPREAELLRHRDDEEAEVERTARLAGRVEHEERADDHPPVVERPASYCHVVLLQSGRHHTMVVPRRE